MKTIQLLQSRLAALGKFFLVGLVLVIPGYFFLYPQIFHCQIIGFSELERINTNIYASPELNTRQRVGILRVIKKAESRIDSFWVGRKATPKLILCGTAREYKKYCQSNDGAGCSLGTPWGESYVILNVQYLNVDVVSHEMSHVELLERLGWWKTTFEIPQWFNEGIALMLDRRFVSNSDSVGRYHDYMDEWLYQTRGGQNILELEELATVKGFFGGNEKRVMLAYMTSGLEISYWLAISGKYGMQALLSEIKNGGTFKESYFHAEQKGRSATRMKLPANPLRIQNFDKKL